jgi:hypothetical protein
MPVELHGFSSSTLDSPFPYGAEVSLKLVVAFPSSPDLSAILRADQPIAATESNGYRLNPVRRMPVELHHYK